MEALTSPEYMPSLSNSAVMALAQKSVQQQSSRLLQLPSEIRNRIYAATLVQSRPIRICDGQSEVEKRSLLGVCRQVYQESEGIYYGGNAFITEPAYYESEQCSLSVDIIHWLRRLGRRKSALLSDVRVCSLWPHLLVQNGQKVDEDREKLLFLRACINRLIHEGLWLPMTVLRVRVGVEYLDICELRQLVGTDERAKHMKCSAPWPPKQPWIRSWKMSAVKEIPWTCQDDCAVCDSDTEAYAGPFI